MDISENFTFNSPHQISDSVSFNINDESPSKLINAAFFIEPNGEIYISPKSHLFSLAGENKIFNSSKDKLIVRYRGWNIALGVCYDVRFPVWSRNRNNEYDLLIYVANWPETRIGAWEKLLPARAIENQSYVIGVNCEGTDNKGNIYNGKSAILNFKGDVILDYSCENELIPVNSDQKIEKNDDSLSGDEENNYRQTLLYAKLSSEKLRDFRLKFPAWKDADNFTIL